MYTKQETFDKVGKFLLKQRGPSVDKNNGGCLYRGPNNAKCAAGCLIPDEKYFDYMDAGNLANGPMIGPVLSSEGYDPNFVRQLQNIHDNNSKNWESWKPAMIKFAEKENLNIDILE